MNAASGASKASPVKLAPRLQVSKKATGHVLLFIRAILWGVGGPVGQKIYCYLVDLLEGTVYSESEMVMEGLRRRSKVTAVLQKRNGSNKELARATKGGKGDKDKTLIVPVETQGKSIGKEVANAVEGKDDATVVPVDDRGKAVVSRENVSDSPNSRGVKRRRVGGGQMKEESLALPAVGGAIKSGQVPARPASARHLARKRGRDADSTAEAGVPFSLTLTKKEILEDLTKMSGHVPYKWRKVKRTNLWGPCNMLSLGRFLHLVTLEKYDPEKFL